MLFAAMLVFAQGMAQFTWNSPLALSASGIDSSAPRIAIDNMGNINAVWVEGSVVHANTMPVGGSWGMTSTAISGSGSSLARLDVDASGNVTALWLESGVVKAATLPFGNSWSSVTPVAVSASGATVPQLFVDSSGNAVAVWIRGTYIESSTQLASPTPTWTTPAQISGAGADGPQVAISDNGTVVAVWHTIVSSQDTLMSATSPIAGSWTAPKTIVTGALHHNYPKVAIDDNGNAVAVWFVYRSNPSTGAYTNVQVLSSTLPFNSGAWTLLPTFLSGSGQRNPSPFNLRVGIDPNGNAVAAWSNSYDGSTFAVETSVRNSAGIWSTSVALDVVDNYAFSSDLAITSSGLTLLCFMAFDGSSTIIQATQTSAPSIFPNFWTSLATISSGIDNGYPRCAVAESSSSLFAGVVWLQYDGSNQIVQVATGTETPIVPPTPVSVVQSSTNFGVFTDVFNTLTWTASTDPNINSYVIYRNGIFFMQTDASTFTAIDHNVTGSPTYTISTLTNNFEQSDAVAFP